MKKTWRFAHSIGTARCAVSPQREVAIPVFPGILKHPTPEALHEILTDVEVARKYTREALRRAPWQILREFNREWLRECMDGAGLSAGRRAALEFLLFP